MGEQVGQQPVRQWGQNKPGKSGWGSGGTRSINDRVKLDCGYKRVGHSRHREQR